MKSLLDSRLVPSLSILCITISLCGVPLSTTQAQVQPPANTSITSSGLNTAVSAPTTLPNGKVNYDITGGTRPGGGPNLFHSFGEFSIATNHIANFLNETALPTSNIIGRINGGQVSNIWGTIQTTGFGGANLYLTNPSGFIFGPTASLNVGGSFAAATADYLRMTDGSKFYADPVQPSVLSIGNVAAFGFTSPRPVAISVQGSTLAVPIGQSLSLVGGDIQILASQVNAPAGLIQVASVGSPGEVVQGVLGRTLDPLDVSSFSRLGRTDIQTSALDASGTSEAPVGGVMVIRSGQLVMDNAGLITTTAALSGGPISIVAPSMQMTGGQIQTVTVGPGAAGDVLVTTGTLTLTAGATISSLTFGPGSAGDVTMRATDSIQLLGETDGPVTVGGIIFPHVPSNITSTTFSSGQGGQVSVSAPAIIQQRGIIDVESFGSGNAGQVEVNVGRLQLLDGAFIGASTTGKGSGGSITVRATEAISIDGFRTDRFPAGNTELINANSAIVTNSYGTGKGGVVFVTSPILKMGETKGGGTIGSNSFGVGDAGETTVDVGQLIMRNGASVLGTTLVAGQGGNITVNAGELISLSGQHPGSFGAAGVTFDHIQTNISSLTLRSGKAGRITVTTPNLDLHDGALISAATGGQGGAGDVTINAEKVNLSTGGQISSSSGIRVGSTFYVGDGAAGAVTIGTRGPVVISDPGSGIFTNAVGDGVGGDINLQGSQVQLTNGASISSTSAGLGNGGTITLTTPTLNLASNATITAQARRGGNAGNINLNVGSLLAQSAAQISSSSVGMATGLAGSITVQGVNGAGSSAQSVSLAGANTSITSDTDNTGRGGDIQIHAGQVQLADLASITVETSGTGKAGSITVASDNLNITGGGRIEASTAGVGNAGDITITNTDAISVSGVSADGQTRSGIFAKTLDSGGTAGGGSGAGSGGGGGGSGGGSGGGGAAPNPGSAGDIAITAKNLLLNGGAQIDSSTTSGGAGGSVSITTTENITITGSSTRLTSDATRGDGTGGNITLVAKNITVRDSASVTAATGGKGDAGNVSLTALDQLLLQSAGTVTTSTSGSGKGGTIVIQAGQILLDGPGTGIAADTLRPFADMTITINILHENEGDLVVQLDSSTGTRVALLSRVGGSGDNFTGTQFNDQATTQITSGSAPFTGTFKPREPLGQLISELVAGNWTLNVRDQATGNVGSLENWTLQIGTQTFQSIGGSTAIPDNGNVRSTITIVNPIVPTVQGIGEAAGIGGDVTINAGTVTVQNGATLSATTRGSGQGGTLTVNATGPVALTGPGSGLFTDSEASGAGGNINVQAARMTMDNGAKISAASSGTGDAGNIKITAGSEFLGTNSSVTTAATQASGGNITLLATDMIHLKNSQINASVFGGPLTAGGNILIDPNFIILQNSQIIAQAKQGAGGNINLTFNQALLTDARSTISATSEFGVSGTVNFNSPTQNLSGALVPLNQSFLSNDTLSNQRCAARMAQGQISTFIVTEREGLPQEPGGMLLSGLVETDGTAASETLEPIRVASVSHPPFTLLTPEPVQLTWSHDTCRR